MAALTVPYNQPRFEAPTQVKLGSIAASVLIPMGTLAMNDAGVAKVFTTAGYLAGASLLGYANQTFDNSAVASTTAMDMMFLRGTPMWLSGLGGDLPTTAEIGKNVALHDNFTCKKTNAGGEASALLLEISGSRYLVMLP